MWGGKKECSNGIDGKIAVVRRGEKGTSASEGIKPIIGTLVEDCQTVIYRESKRAEESRESACRRWRRPNSHALSMQEKLSSRFAVGLGVGSLGGAQNKKLLKD